MRLYLIWGTTLALLGINAALLLAHDRLALLLINARGGCYPWSPPEVEYHDGMTLCPGQAVRVPFAIPNDPNDTRMQDVTPPDHHRSRPL